VDARQRRRGARPGVPVGQGRQGPGRRQPVSNASPRRLRRHEPTAAERR
jgi:hypothetical protein